MTRYQQIAQQIISQIEQGVWRVGEKIPSIRVSCKSFEASNSTILQAYQLLEAQGWITAKPQSGYYVANLHLVDKSHQQKAEQRALFDDQLFQFLKTSSSESAQPFSSAFPDPDLFPMADLAKSLANATRKMVTSQSEPHLPPGNPTLRRLIAQRYAKRGLHISSQDIVITSGAMEALNLSLQAVTNPGDKVIIESPVFYGALQAVEKLGLIPIEVPIEKGGGLSIERLKERLDSHDIKACWLMSSFQNPTGLSLSDEKKRAIVELANQHDFFIVEDDVYGELQYDDEQPQKPLKAFDREDRVLLCSSFSKSLCPGYRVGWLVNQRFNEQVQKSQLLSTLSTSAPIQAGVAHYLTYESYDNHLRKLRREFVSRYEEFRNWMLNVLPDDVELSQPQGGYFVWLYLPESVDIHAIKDKMKEAQWPIATNELFVAHQSHSAIKGIRLNFSYSMTEQRQSALTQLGKALSEHRS
ncbi:PLP-dependent aminotransferase family protein [Vibrio maerlii]|uniref:aminotransferase-like domain-containing protein n=1 Tax=Vibrio maerlii TaxID=2231648 RepID=UPI000E3D6FB6|nr:PLP-dependent aminotransferase family protein [Vibrio maerlii]